MRPAGSPLQGADDFRRFSICSNHHRGSYTSPALAAASYPFVDLLTGNTLRCKLFPANNLAALQSEYEALQAQKEALYADYGKLKKKVREYDIIKQNIDSILQADRQPEREKGTERG